MHKRRSRKRAGRGLLVVDVKQQNLISQWALTVLLDLRVWKKLERKSSGFTDDRAILDAVGLGHLEDEEMNRKQFLEALESQQEKFANEPAAPNKHLALNCQEIADYIGLNDVERQILLFTVLLKEDRGLQEVLGKLGVVNVEVIAVVLSTILELGLQEIRDALSRQGLLARAGLMSVDRDSKYEIDNKLDLLAGLGEALQEPEVTVETLLQHYFTLAGPSELTKKDYLHEKDNFAMIREHLAQACKQHSAGVNILVYGPPGTGKTEFAKTVAKTLGCKLYEVNIGDEEDPYDKPKRMRAFQLAQQVLSRQKKALILFDEIDSLLTESFSFLHDGGALNLKAWINKNLETCPVPAIWIANDISFAESAFIRRFDIVFNLNPPPRSTRLEILGNYLQGIPVSSQWMERLAYNRYIVSFRQACVDRFFCYTGVLRKLFCPA